MNKNGNIQTFLGCDSSYKDANIVIFGAPFDSTTSYRPGTRFASKTMRSESYGFETYSPYYDKDLMDLSIYDSGDIELPFGDTKTALDMINDWTNEIVNDGKIPVMIGGEHLVSLATVKAVHKKYNDIRIIHFDAHADLRDDYLGQKFSHATVMRRIWDIVGDDKIYQFGIRSGEKEEFVWSKSHVEMNKFGFDNLEATVENLKNSNNPIYLSIDLDILDPSVFPGTGTPEAGGVTFEQLRLAIKFVCDNLNVVAADVNELAPNYDHSGASTAVACKIFRELLLGI